MSTDKIETAFAKLSGEMFAEDIEAAGRDLMLAELEGYISDVNAAAEADVLAGNAIEGAHHRAMETVAAKHRAEIAALGNAQTQAETPGSGGEGA